MLEQVIGYLEAGMEPSPDWAEKLEKLAAEERVPIMEPLGIRFLMQLVRLHQPDKILEIGTAIGYSALMMLEAKPDAEIITVERDEHRYEQAVLHIKERQAAEHILALKGDAFDLHSKITEQGPYDFVFIDAAKGQYQRFFEAYSELLTDKGVIISDNVLFKGFVADDAEATKNTAKIAKKLRGYNQWLMEHEDFHTSIMPIGDGVAISVKKQAR